MSSHPLNREKVCTFLFFVFLTINLTLSLPNLPGARSRELPSLTISGCYYWFNSTLLVIAEPFRNSSHYGFHIEYIHTEL